MSKKRRILYQELIIGFGFLNGLWIHAGENPEAEIIKAFTDLIPEMSTFLFWLISILAIIFAVAMTFKIGRWWGLAGVFLAFIGGVFIDTSVGVWALIIGLLIGLYAPLSNRR